MDRNFASDNVVGASAPVMEALLRANGAGSMPSYGADALARDVTERLGAIFEREVFVSLVATGTAANALALAAAVHPWGICLCHEESHVAEDECGAPEFFTGGAKLLGLPGIGGKLSAATLGESLRAMPSDVEHRMPPEAVTLSQATECGTVYTPDEIGAIGDVCRAHRLAFHMDGARFANALLTLGCTPADMTWRAGVDILSFGATKNGCLAAEAIVVFDPALAGTVARRRKRAGHTLSKGRLVSSQMQGYLADDHWLDNAQHANAAARRLAAGLSTVPGVELGWPVEANEVFPLLPDAIADGLKADGFVFRDWSPRSLPPDRAPNGRTLFRLVTSFATSDEAVDAFLASARSAVERNR